VAGGTLNYITLLGRTPLRRITAAKLTERMVGPPSILDLECRSTRIIRNGKLRLRPDQVEKISYFAVFLKKLRKMMNLVNQVNRVTKESSPVLAVTSSCEYPSASSPIYIGTCS
jgi:hypothetical protein